MKLNLKHPYKEVLINIAKIVKKKQYEIFLVGGTVRDTLLGTVSTDIDLATNATPDIIEKLFEVSYPTGKDYGTITVMYPNETENIPIQITTYRADGDYSNTRHPDTVTFETSIKDDVKRRDFTINALAYDPLTDELIDNVNGYKDMQNKQLRTVGPPMKRFQEDSLRLVRCCRFMAQLEFSCETQTWDALCHLAETIALPSKERITEELLKLLESKKPSLGLDALIRSKLGDRLLPKISKIPKTIITDMDTIETDIRLAYLLNALDVKACLNQLRISNQKKRKINDLIRCNFDHKKACFKKTDLALSGAKIKSMGFTGKQIGMIQQECYMYVLKDLTNNTKEKLREYIKQLEIDGKIP